MDAYADTCRYVNTNMDTVVDAGLNVSVNANVNTNKCLV
jgi:hypothetical protein